MRLHGTPLIGGEVHGRVLRFERPISFWGGIDPATGIVTDPRHPQHGASIAGRVIVLPATVGSSSSSYIMLELIARGQAPAAVVVAEPDAILSLGVLVAREMGYDAIPVTQLPLREHVRLATGTALQVQRDGTLVAMDDTPD